MSIYYNGSHAMTFVRISDELVRKTWDDFHLVPSKKYYLDPPKPELKYLKLPRSKKILDLTESLNGIIEYEGSEGTWDFYIDHDKWENLHTILEEIAEYFDGTMFKVTLDDEPDYTYTGTVKVESYDVKDDYSIVRLSYSLNWYLEDTIPVQTEVPNKIVIPKIGSGSDYYKKASIIQEQIIPISNVVSNVYYINVEYDRKNDTYTTEIKKYDATYTYDDYGSPYTERATISDPIEIVEEASYPNYPFTSDKYENSFTFGIKATWVRPPDEYFHNNSEPFTFRAGATHYNFRDDYDYVEDPTVPGSAYSMPMNVRDDYDNPFEMDDQEAYEYGTYSELDYTIPFRIALKITAANDEQYIDGFMTFGSGSSVFDDVFKENRPKVVDKKVEVTGTQTSITQYIRGGINSGGVSFDHWTTKQVPKKTTFYKYSDGYYETDSSDLYKFNLNGGKNYSSFYINKGPSNSKDYYRNKNILNEFSLKFLHDEYGIEFDTSNLYLYRSAKAGRGRYLVSIDRYI